MAWYQFAIDYGWEIGGGIALIIIVFFAIRWGNKRKGHVHKFVDAGYMMINNQPRMIRLCKKCRIAIHTPIFTKKQLRDVEERDEFQSFKKRKVKEEPIEDEEDW